MEGFTIYALVLTVIYIAYMMVVIMLDLRGKKGQKKDEAEVFNMSNGGVEEEDASTVIEETEEGYFIGGTKADSSQSEVEQSEVKQPEAPVIEEEEDDDYIVDQLEQPVDDDLDDESVLQQESEESLSAYERVKAVQRDEMMVATPTFQGQHSSEEFAELMAQGMGEDEKILMTIVDEH